MMETKAIERILIELEVEGIVKDNEYSASQALAELATLTAMNKLALKAMCKCGHTFGESHQCPGSECHKCDCTEFEAFTAEDHSALTAQLATAEQALSDQFREMAEKNQVERDGAQHAVGELATTVELLRELGNKATLYLSDDYGLRTCIFCNTSYGFEDNECPNPECATTKARAFIKEHDNEPEHGSTNDSEAPQGMEHDNG